MAGRLAAWRRAVGRQVRQAEASLEVVVAVLRSLEDWRLQAVRLVEQGATWAAVVREVPRVELRRVALRLVGGSAPESSRVLGYTLWEIWVESMITVELGASGGPSTDKTSDPPAIPVPVILAFLSDGWSLDSIWN